MAGGSREAGRSVTSRVLALLGAFDATHTVLGVRDLSRRAEVAVSTAHRSVAELEDWGALARRTDGRHEVGRRLWQLALLAPVTGSGGDIALPSMQDVLVVTGDDVQMAVRAGFEALYIERIYGKRPVPVLSGTGARLPLHATRGAKCCWPTHRPGWWRRHCATCPWSPSDRHRSGQAAAAAHGGTPTGLRPHTRRDDDRRCLDRRSSARRQRPHPAALGIVLDRADGTSPATSDSAGRRACHRAQPLRPARLPVTASCSRCRLLRACDIFDIAVPGHRGARRGRENPRRRRPSSRCRSPRRARLGRRHAWVRDREPRRSDIPSAGPRHGAVLDTSCSSPLRS